MIQFKRERERERERDRERERASQRECKKKKRKRGQDGYIGEKKSESCGRGSDKRESWINFFIYKTLCCFFSFQDQEKVLKTTGAEVTNKTLRYDAGNNC